MPSSAIHPIAEDVYVAQIAFGPDDQIGYLTWANGPSAKAAAASVPLEDDEELRSVSALDELLAPWRERIARGEAVTISFKHETATAGPVFLGRTPSDAEIDEDPNVERGGIDNRALLVKFGYEPPWSLTLPWTEYGQAQELAAALGLELGVS